MKSPPTNTPRPVDLTFQPESGGRLFDFEPFDDNPKSGCDPCDPQRTYATVKEKSQTRCGRICCTILWFLIVAGTVTGIVIGELDYICKNPQFRKTTVHTIPLNTTNVVLKVGPGVTGVLRVRQGSKFSLEAELRSNRDELFKFRQSFQVTKRHPNRLGSYEQQVEYSIQNDQSYSLTNCPSINVTLVVPASTDLDFIGKSLYFNFGKGTLGNVKVTGGVVSVEQGKLDVESFSFKTGSFHIEGEMSSNSTLAMETLTGFIVINKVYARDSLSLSSIHGVISIDDLKVGASATVTSSSGPISMEIEKAPGFKGKSEMTVRAVSSPVEVTVDGSFACSYTVETESGEASIRTPNGAQGLTGNLHGGGDNVLSVTTVSGPIKVKQDD